MQFRAGRQLSETRAPALGLGKNLAQRVLALFRYFCRFHFV
jgi:hypothetical protein